MLEGSKESSAIFVAGLRGVTGLKRTAENTKEVNSTETVPGGQHLDRETTADNGVKRFSI